MNKIFFTSSTGNQVSYEYEAKKMGYFSYFLLQGLQGKAGDIRNPEYIDIGELGTYVTKNVFNETKKKYKSAPQLPDIIFVEGSNIDDFPVAIRKQ